MDNPDKFFQGYCFVGSDYIFGENGFEKFYNEKGIKINGGEDGCYIIMESKNNSFSFSSDFSGNKKIFYYWNPGFWIVSNSIFLIVEHLKNNNVTLIANYSQLAAIGVPTGSFYNQLYSVNTFIEGIKLLPTGNFLKISNSSYSIEKLNRTIAFNGYEEGLSIFIRTWIARLVGLLDNGFNVQSDLTGGADSRTVFAMLKYAVEKAKVGNNLPSFRSGSTENNTIDLKIANIIGQFYDLPINEGEFPILKRFTGEESYTSWKALCLGVYHPVYFPTFGPQSDIVSLGGAGAENHRPFYKDQNVESFIKSNASRVSPKWLSYNIIAELETEFKRMGNTNSEVDPMILHYRQYRNRMHSGRTPQYKSFFNPLGSKLLEDVSEIAGADRLKVGQINYDLMSTLLPSILEIPFDSPSKALNEVRKKNLTTLTDWGEMEIGKSYVDERVENNPRERTDSALELLNADFQASKMNPFVKEFFGKDFIEKANDTMSNAIEHRKFPHAIDAQGIVAIIAGGLFE